MTGYRQREKPQLDKRSRIFDGAPRKAVGLSRVGIYAGTFNPVHSGHIAFALQALKLAKLDAVYFIVEQQPRHKNGVEHQGHRIAMLRRALLPHPQLDILELPDRHFTVTRTLPRLHQKLPGAQLVFLMGSDVVRYLAEWKAVDRLLASCELFIGRRAGDSEKSIFAALDKTTVESSKVYIIESYAKSISSSTIRRALRDNLPAHGLLQSVYKYVKREWLYLKNT